MPFDQRFPRSITSASVRAHAPARSGVYGLSNAREWIYIGETDNIQEALWGHIQQLETTPVNQKPTGFVFELCAPAGRAARQDRLVLEYEPAGNRHSSRNRSLIR
jgi:hypothetical protein